LNEHSSLLRTIFSSELGEKVESKEITVPLERALKLASNYILTELRKYFAENGEDITTIKITPENYAEFIGIVADGKINSSAAQTVLAEMYKGGDNDPSHIIERLNLAQMSDSSELEAIVDTVLVSNEKSVLDLRLLIRFLSRMKSLFLIFDLANKMPFSFLLDKL